MFRNINNIGANFHFIPGFRIVYFYILSLITKFYYKHRIIYTNNIYTGCSKIIGTNFAH